jgi:hypothetical protein
MIDECACDLKEAKKTLNYIYFDTWKCFVGICQEKIAFDNSSAKPRPLQSKIGPMS